MNLQSSYIYSINLRIKQYQIQNRNIPFKKALKGEPANSCFVKNSANTIPLTTAGTVDDDISG